MKIKDLPKVDRPREKLIQIQRKRLDQSRLKASKVGWWRVKESDLKKFLNKNSNV